MADKKDRLPGPDAAAAVPELSSRDLFRHANTVRIEHNGEHYWLRLTRGNKLILTK
jgi:hemin uptake protein HemP